MLETFLPLVCPLAFGLPKRIWPSCGTGFPPPLIQRITTWLVAQLDCYLTEKYAVFFPTGLAKQVAEVESSLIILAIFDSSRLSFEPNLALLHALHITISVLTNSNLVFFNFLSERKEPPAETTRLESETLKGPGFVPPICGGGVGVHRLVGALLQIFNV